MDVSGCSSYLIRMRKIDSGIQVWPQKRKDFEGTLHYAHEQTPTKKSSVLEANQVLIFLHKLTGRSIPWKRIGSSYVETSRIQIH